MDLAPRFQPDIHSQDPDPALQLLEAQLEEVERVQMTARGTLLAFLEGSPAWRQAEVVFAGADKRRRELLSRIDAVALKRR